MQKKMKEIYHLLASCWYQAACGGDFFIISLRKKHANSPIDRWGS